MGIAGDLDFRISAYIIVQRIDYNSKLLKGVKKTKKVKKSKNVKGFNQIK